MLANAINRVFRVAYLVIFSDSELSGSGNTVVALGRFGFHIDQITFKIVL